jgi:hypothetical protein
VTAATVGAGGKPPTGRPKGYLYTFFYFNMKIRVQVHWQPKFESGTTLSYETYDSQATNSGFKAAEKKFGLAVEKTQGARLHAAERVTVLAACCRPDKGRPDAGPASSWPCIHLM